MVREYCQYTYLLVLISMTISKYCLCHHGPVHDQSHHHHHWVASSSSPMQPMMRVCWWRISKWGSGTPAGELPKKISFDSILCSLSPLCILLFALCILHFEFCTFYFAFCTLQFAHCILHIVLCTLHLAFCTLYFALCILNTLLTVCTLHFALCILHLAFCSLHSIRFRLNTLLGAMRFAFYWSSPPSTCTLPPFHFALELIVVVYVTNFTATHLSKVTLVWFTIFLGCLLSIYSAWPGLYYGRIVTRQDWGMP